MHLMHGKKGAAQYNSERSYKQNTIIDRETELLDLQNAWAYNVLEYTGTFDDAGQRTPRNTLQTNFPHHNSAGVSCSRDRVAK